MTISRASEYAIRALLYMATFPPEQVIGKKDICKTQQITPGFFIKIMQPLISEGLVKSYRGSSGGFSLGKPPAKISMWDIICLEEGPILLNECMIQEGFCDRDKKCPVHNIWRQAKGDLENTLKEATLASLLRQAISG